MRVGRWKPTDLNFVDKVDLAEYSASRNCLPPELHACRSRALKSSGAPAVLLPFPCSTVVWREQKLLPELEGASTLLHLPPRLALSHHLFVTRLLTLLSRRARIVLVGSWMSGVVDQLQGKVCVDEFAALLRRVALVTGVKAK